MSPKKADRAGTVERSFQELKRQRALGEIPFISTHFNSTPYQLFQRLRFYKKRLWSAEQKQIAAVRHGKPISKKIEKAIVNNRDWVDFYTFQIKESGYLIVNPQNQQRWKTTTKMKS